ncbi:MAG: hypothetical protein M1826_005393 [Phylliscum demangeonii]|nr:MAG: hypothetical protein M1826_005393 [Phylliscum demangeonii]
MKFVLYILPVSAIIVGSISLYIPLGQWEQKSRQLAQPNTPRTSADRAGKKTSWAPHAVEPRVPKQPMLAKRTTDEENPPSPADVNRVADSRKGPVTYTSDQLATFQGQFNAAKRASTVLQKKLKRARAAGLEVSQDDLDELSRLTAVTTQRRLVLRRARLGKPLDRRTSVAKQDVAVFVQDPQIQELAKSGPYSAQQLADYKRSFYDAQVEFHSMKRTLANVARMRKVTEAEEKALADLNRACNLQKNIWYRVRQGKPADYRVDHPKKSLEHLLESAKLHDIAQSTGYSVTQLAEAQRRYLDSSIKASAFKRELADVAKAREVTPEEKTHLRTLLRAMRQQRWVFDRMCLGKSVDGGAPLLKKDIPSLLNDPEIQRIAQRGGYSVEEVAVQRRAYLDAMNKYRAARNRFSARKKDGGTLTPEEEADFSKLLQSYQLQNTAWDRMEKGARVDPAIQPRPKLGQKAQADKINPSRDGRSATYTAEQIDAYNAAQLDALRTLRAFQKKLAAAAHPPTADDEKQLQTLRADFNEKKRMGTRARSGKPVDRKVYSRRAGSAPTSARSPETRPGSQEEQASQASSSKEDRSSTTHPPLQISSGPRHLLAPVLSSARRLLHSLGLRWRAWPWSRSLAHWRLNTVQPAELLRAEHAL